MLYEIRGILQNVAMGIAPVRNFAARYHLTGMNGDPTSAARMLAHYRELTDIQDKDVLELGPGQTPEVLILAKRAGARTCTGLDIQAYDAALKDHGSGVAVRVYDGSTFPVSDGSVDVVWSSDVLEHVRRPRRVVDEMARVLRPGGVAIAHVDLRDHYFLDREPKWFECLKYSERMWNAIAWNRSSFVNRVRASEWRDLFRAAGLRIRSETTRTSEVLARRYDEGAVCANVRTLTRDDACTYAIDIVADKPLSR